MTMEGQIQNTPKKVAVDQFNPEIDNIRAVSNFSATALSAHTILTSATIQIAAVGASNQVKLHMENMQIANEEFTWLTVEVRDGGFTGRRLFGPWTIQAGQQVNFSKDDLRGRAALSSIEAVILSSPRNPPVSNAGVIFNVGVTVERLDLRDN